MTSDTLTRTAPGTAPEADLAATMAGIGHRAREAAAALALVSAEAKVAALQAAAVAVRSRANEILAANAEDVAEARHAGIGAALVDRLALDPKRLEGVAKGLEDIAALPDPVGRVLAQWTRPNGLDISRVSVPLGVIGIIYESRPNVTADAGGHRRQIRQCGDPARRLGKLSFVARAGRRAAPGAARGGAAGRRDPAGADPRPRGRGHDAEDERGHRRHRAARRGIPDRAGAAREPHPGHRPSRRAVPHLCRRRRRPREGARHRAQRQDAAGVDLRRDRDPAGRPCGRAHDPAADPRRSCAPPAANCAATRRRWRSSPRRSRRPTRIGGPNTSTPFSRCGSSTGWRARSSTSTASARITPTRS